MIGTWKVHRSSTNVKPGSDCADPSIAYNEDWGLFDIVLEHSPDKKKSETSHASFSFALGHSGAWKDASSGGRISWTTIHDEGLIFQADNLVPAVYYGHFGYDNGRSVCDVIPHGWVVAQTHNAAPMLFCFSAKRIDVAVHASTPFGVIAPISSTPLTSESFLVANWSLSPSELDQFAQGRCGSCFALGFAYAFERVLMKLLPGRKILLDREALLACSYSTQGCGGGWYSSLTLDTMITGIPVAGCMQPGISAQSGVSQGCLFYDQNSSCYSDPSTLFYPSGFVELQNQAGIKKFLVESGPVLTSVVSSNLTDPLSNPEQRPVDGAVDPVTHGVVIIGWSEDQEGNALWDVYNPWGAFATVARHETGLVERNAVGVTPDLTRGALNGIGKKRIRKH